MKKIDLTPREGLSAIAEQYGFDFYIIDGQTYWDESRAYQFTLNQVEKHIEDPTAELHQMLLEAVGRVIVDEKELQRFGIPSVAWDTIRDSWKNKDLSVYGRMDLCYDGTGPAKLYEANYDTPTSLFEASVFQWDWLRDQFPDADQYNSIHEELIKRWKLIKDTYKISTMHAACVTDSVEDTYTTNYMLDCATQAGLVCKLLDIEDVGIGKRKRDGVKVFTDLEDEAIEALFKLYPYEHMWREAFAKDINSAMTGFVEPPWKAVISNKAIIAKLWEMFPKHPNLIETYFGNGHIPDGWVRKPYFSREGANIYIPGVAETHEEELPGGYILQKYTPLPCFGDSYPVIGSWVIGDKPCGMGIREDSTLITRNTSRFVPHLIR